MKKKWVKPKLIVLVRGRVEENVLNSCKTAGTGIRGPNNTRPMCAVLGHGCSSLAAS